MDEKPQAPREDPTPVPPSAAPPPTAPAAAQQPAGPPPKVPFFEKLMYGAGSGSYQLSTTGVMLLANPIYNITLHLDPRQLGLVQTIARIFDAFTDPLVGSISDNFRSRWGRRRPFIFVGSILTAFAFALIWHVDPAWGINQIFWYFLGTMLLFYFCSTIQVIPYHTLGLEMTRDYNERTVISGYKLFFSYIFLLGIPWVFRIAQSDYFPDVMTGVRTSSYFLALAIIVGGMLPAFFVKERYYRLASTQEKVPFFRAAGYTFRNKAFLFHTAIVLCMGVGSGMVGMLGPYVIYYHVYGGDLKAGASLDAVVSNVGSILSLLSIPLVTWVARKIGKVRALKLFLVVLSVGVASKFFLYNKDFPWLVPFVHLLVAPGGVAFWTLTTSMKADICDDDEYQHGTRREGMFGAVGNWVTKLAGSLTLLLGGYILWLTGFNAELGANQDPQGIFLMRVLFAGVPLVFNLVCLLIINRYPLTQERSAMIEAELERRRTVKVDD